VIRDERRRRALERAPERDAVVPPPTDAAVLALQVAAGNHAVSSLLQGVKEQRVSDIRKQRKAVAAGPYTGRRHFQSLRLQEQQGRAPAASPALALRRASNQSLETVEREHHSTTVELGYRCGVNCPTGARDALARRGANRPESRQEPSGSFQQGQP
jgi:hypothetical protein